MDQQQRFFIQRIVGGPQRVVLGASTAPPTAFSFEALPLQRGRHWRLPRIPRKLPPRMKRVQLGALAIGAVSLVAAATVYWPTNVEVLAAASVAPAPLSQAPQELQQPAPVSVAVVNDGFVAGEQGLPIAPPKAVVAAVGPPVQPSPSRTERTEPVKADPPLLVLDAKVEQRAGPALVPAATTPTPSGAPAVAAPAMKLAVPIADSAAAPVTKPTTPARLSGASAPSAVNAADLPSVTVVDIDKAGAFALITNPQTRLPVKIEPGQKIFTGEVLRKIDPAAGKLVLDSRTISMQ